MLSCSCSLSTVSREFAALKGLPYYDFYSDILNPRLSRVLDISPDQIQKAKNAYRVNEPQAIAILSAIKTEGFTLVQGYASSSYRNIFLTLLDHLVREKPGPFAVL